MLAAVTAVADIPVTMLDNIMSKLGEMMPMADDRQRDILENAMHQLENA